MWTCSCCTLFRKLKVDLYKGFGSEEKAQDHFFFKSQLFSEVHPYIFLTFIKHRLTFIQEYFLTEKYFTANKLCFLFCLGAVHFIKKSLVYNYTYLSFFLCGGHFSIGSFKCFTKCKCCLIDAVIITQYRQESSLLAVYSYQGETKNKFHVSSLVCILVSFLNKTY